MSELTDYFETGKLPIPTLPDNSGRTGLAFAAQAEWGVLGKHYGVQGPLVKWLGKWTWSNPGYPAPFDFTVELFTLEDWVLFHPSPYAASPPAVYGLAQRRSLDPDPFRMGIRLK